MPEYLAPGVFVEEVTYRASSIADVSTSTTGFAGRTHYGPVQYAGGPRACEPRLVTSYAEFERVYGGLETYDDLTLAYLAHAARAYFLNGGQRLYVSRVYEPPAGTGVASSPDIPVAATGGPALARWRARWPGQAGNVSVTVTATRSGDVGLHTGAAAQANGVRTGTVLEVIEDSRQPGENAMIDPARLRILRIEPDLTQTFLDAGGNPAPPPVSAWLLPVEVTVTVTDTAQRQTSYPRLGLAPDGRRALSRVLDRDDPQDEDCMVWFEHDFRAQNTTPIQLLVALLAGAENGPTRTYRLTGGSDGQAVTAAGLLGAEADPDDATRKATGLYALGEVDAIAIEAAPDIGAMEEADQRVLATQNLIRHAELARYRIAVVDGPMGASLNEIRAFRGNFDSKYAALYHPWVEILDPITPPPGVPTPCLRLPPSGFVAGIYARSDVTRGVFKAPANEVVYGLTRLEVNINTGRNQVLNPEHVNALRFFAGRGNRVWGARTLSSDPEWLYVNVRRLFIFLEHSIDLSTQWAVFEPNGDRLWRSITQTVADFLNVQWRNGALLGTTPAQAYFVRCDRSTMTQNDLDNGRLICEIGVAPVRPAEFVIFRIGQFTADARG
ncbi:phage tail sheath family protein [Amycolatopsis kentuckyensis]|uniref:phage tail sheath family protein n=1 Tax=Amycolatopsis kentuckyensis TaxID=218823 RepID=UPI000A3AB704|nr:phage tail sheath subtilisin-like domain-containing protein [Amycolatopsis kentuckyensis]